MSQLYPARTPAEGHSFFCDGCVSWGVMLPVANDSSGQTPFEEDEIAGSRLLVSVRSPGNIRQPDWIRENPPIPQSSKCFCK